MSRLDSLHNNESENSILATIVGGNRWKVNSYLIKSKKTGRAFMIDAGGESEEILSALDFFSGNIDFILLTHGHFDHLSSAAAICARYSLPCLVHPNDLKLARHAPFYAISYDALTVTIPKPLLKMELPDSRYCAEWNMTVMETPGHTAGSCCYIVDKFVFTGDTLIKEATGRTDQPGGNPDAIFRSIADVLQKAPGDGVIFPGHGCHWSVAEARIWWNTLKEKPPEHNSFL